ncbi:MAG TPA: adenylate/guanylate cyclase domain-containing protein [Candidatus Ozemobacteraceae bacterium]|nr:adenylate/guanylate cyclase domain-containing protein [Candidatus Ozemobacteraceae bacterium]
MAERATSASRIPHLLLIPLLLLVGWFCLDVIEGRREQAIRIQNIDALRNRLPLIRERLNPTSLAHEKILAGLHGFDRLTPVTARHVAARWRTAFGSSVSYALWDETSTLLESRGFTARDLRALRAITYERRIREQWEPIPGWLYQEYFPSLVHLFGKHVSFLERNPIALKTTVFLGVSGQLMIGPWFPTAVLDNESHIDLASASEVIRVGAVPCAGEVVLFVPHRVIRSAKWLKHALKLPTERLGIPRVHLVSRRRLASEHPGIPGLSPELARAVLFESESLSEGVLLDAAGTGVAFATKAGWPNGVVVHVSSMPVPFRVARSPLVTGILLLLLAGAGMLVRSGAAAGLASGLVRQCLLVSVLVAFIPVCGLVWIGFIGAQSSADSRHTEAMQRLERRLEQIEAGHVTSMSTLVKPLRRFFDDPAWRRGMPPTPWVASQVADLKSSLLQTLYVFEGDGTSHAFYRVPLPGEAGKAAKQARVLITSLLQYIQSTILSQEGGSNGDQRANLQRELKGGMVYDVIALAVSPESVYQLAITFDQLMPFQMFHETTLVIFHHVLDETLKPTILLFAVLHRKFLIQLEIVELINARTASATDTPDLVLMQDDEREWPMTFPISCTMEPGLNLLMRRLKSEGGNIQTELPVKGVPCRILARPLAGTDLIGAAVEPIEAASRLTGLPALLAAAYPLTIVILALMLFQAFFLRPVGEMRKTVEAIAAGDYERRLPVLTDDEIGGLCLSFNRMAQDLAEKEFLRRFISDLTMQAVAGRHRETATRLTATVLFTDIRSFTTMSETQPPERITAMLNAYLTRMESVIEANGGTIDKFIGDAIMAVFLPTHGMAPSAERAIRAAFGMRRELEAFNEARRAAGEFTIATGSGIATGEILMGVLGRSDGRQDFTVTGPTVNKAAAMEKRSKEARRVPVVVCPDSLEVLAGKCVSEPLPAVENRPIGFEIVSLGEVEVS